MKKLNLNLYNPWTRFWLSSLAVLVVFAIFILIYVTYKHPYYGARFIGVNFFKEAEPDGIPLYEIVSDKECINIISPQKSSTEETVKDKEAAKDKDVARDKAEASALVPASSPHCTNALSIPADAKQLGSEGFIKFALMLTQEGKVKRGDIEQTSGSDVLDQTALKQITESIQFEPCKKSGQAIACRQEIKFRWKNK